VSKIPPEKLASIGLSPHSPQTAFPRPYPIKL
jgi:hypothetical protein